VVTGASNAAPCHIHLPHRVSDPDNKGYIVDMIPGSCGVPDAASTSERGLQARQALFNCSQHFPASPRAQVIISTIQLYYILQVQTSPQITGFLTGQRETTAAEMGQVKVMGCGNSVQ
jgi:hypothetical protein